MWHVAPDVASGDLTLDLTPYRLPARSDADLPSEHELPVSSLDFRGGLLHCHPPLAVLRPRGFPLHDPAEHGARAARPVLPRAPRRGDRDRLPLLPHVGRE